MPEPAVVTVIREWREDLAARERSQLSAMASAWKDVEGALEDRMFSLAAQIADEGGVPSLGQLGRMERYQELLRQLRVETRKYAADLVPTIEGEQLAYGRAGIDSAVQAINAVGGPSIAGSFNVLPISAVESMVGLAGDGSPLSKLLDETWPDGASAMTQALIRSTALGVNPRVTARQMARATEASLDRMMVIARSEQMRVFRLASLDSFRASGVVRQWKRLAARSTRTCLGCLAADGRIYSTADGFDSHPQCRCTSVPIVDGYPEAEWQRGPQWLMSQPESVQRDMLGPERYRLLKSGAVNFEDFATTRHDPVWGGSIVPTSVAELQRMADAASAA